jgi:hypothetical protein
MLTMQAFHQSLSLTEKTPNVHQNQLVNLTHLTRDRILALASEFTWIMWTEDDDGSGPK